MRLRYSLTYYKLLIVSTQFHIGSHMIRQAIAMMPEDHPGKTYAKSRTAEGHERLSAALAPKAASRLIRERRLAAQQSY